MPSSQEEERDRKTQVKITGHKGTPVIGEIYRHVQPIRKTDRQSETDRQTDRQTDKDRDPEVSI